MKRKLLLGLATAAVTLAMVGGSVAAAQAAPEQSAGRQAAVLTDVATPSGQLSALITCDPNGGFDTTAATGVPNCNFWEWVQLTMAESGGYTGAIDGLMGTGSWKGVQQFLNIYSGAGLVVDGVAGSGTIRALQTYFNNYIYPVDNTPLVVDGLLGTQTYKAWASWIELNQG